ncbi:hypothetical protein BN997_00174 [Oceanobacillus oncorhynchi]|uniref:Uncharacterized protein n=1 Tax=Oceanobacillus oncorhynchi TaxID=545501 RepID=A0A0A1MMQ8_9BACI|nr:hypothetical protein [Oceanobacillus oncorhynchi]CEI80371.1 hypothetical protein BN997_00174 [Oceanobacillus oncorhynchi]
MENLKIEKMKDKLNGHSLESLWSKADTIIRKYYSDDVKEDDKLLKNTRKAILELHDMDKKSTLYRYPFDNELQKQKVGDSDDDYAIDYTHLKKEFDKVY